MNRVQSMYRTIDMTRLGPRLYQGSAPPAGPTLRNLGFDAVVLCAMEHQPPTTHFPGVRVFRARLDDSGEPVTSREWTDALTAATSVANTVRQGGRVLVTCIQGRNRSGLVSALALHMLTRAPGTMCVRHIQTLRPGALTNREFVRLLEHIR